MAAASNSRQSNDLLGSVRAFVSLAGESIERRLLSELPARRLTAAQLLLLNILAKNDGMHVGQVAALLGVSEPAASKATDRLVRRRLLRRREAHDRRVVELFLTERARHLLTVYEKLKEQELALLGQLFCAQELDDVIALLDRSSAALMNSTQNGKDVCLRCGLFAREQCPLRELSQVNCFYQCGSWQTDREDKVHEHPGHRA
jgi:DNA-binding MarR family transcriptional regulator